MQVDITSIVLAGLALLPAGLATRASLRLAYGARGPEPGDATHLTVLLLSWVMIAYGVLTLLAIAFLPSLILAFIIAYALLDLVQARRAQDRKTAWSLVAGAAAVGQPMRLAAELGRDRFSGGARRRFESFGRSLAAGGDTPTAIATHRSTFPRSAQGLAALAGQGDQRILVRDLSDDSATADAWLGIVGRLSYLLLLCGMMAAVVLFLLIQIVPEFRTIFDDFEVKLPQATQALIATAGLFFDLGGGVLLATFTPLFMLAAFVVWLLYLVGLEPLQPLLDRLFFGRHRAQVLRLLAIAIEEGLPLEAALGRLAAGRPAYASSYIASRLQDARRRAEQGVDWREALLDAGLLHAKEQPLLHAAERAGNLPWALYGLADQANSRSATRWQLALHTAFPAVIIALGLVVGWVVIGLFVPLVTLISRLA
ncbi:MAG: type II secretion system F family protein [Planctomycetota bacterium]